MSEVLTLLQHSAPAPRSTKSWGAAGRELARLRPLIAAHRDAGELDILQPLRWRTTALERHRALPPASDLEQAAVSFRSFATGRTDREAAELCISALLDAIPAAKLNNPSAFIEAASEILDDEDEDIPELFRGFTPQVVAQACRELLKTSTFAPSIAEILKACRVARAAFLHGARELDRLAHIRANADRILLETGDLVPPALEDAQWDDTIPMDVPTSRRARA